MKDKIKEILDLHVPEELKGVKNVFVGKRFTNATRLDEEKVTKAIKQEFPYASIIWLKEFAKAICTAHSKGELIADEELTGEPFPSVDEIEDENICLN